VSALTGDQLAKSGVTDVQGLQYRTPSLSITSAQSQRNTVAFSPHSPSKSLISLS
jgi:iron complex outermembrane receptor protein